MPYSDREKRIAYHRERRKKLGLTRPPKVEVTVEERREYHRNHYAKNRGRIKVMASNKQQRRKKEAIEGYGGKCLQCGETELEFLTLDHVEDDGYSHRVGKNNMYIWARANGFPPVLQCLCFTCNVEKGLSQRAAGVSAASRTIQKQRQAVIAHYGSKCSCCGSTRSLAIDHVHGGGCKHRRGKGYIYSEIIKAKFPASYRLLCANCNHSARMGNGVCIHQRKVSGEKIDHYRKLGFINPFEDRIDISKEKLESLRATMTNDQISDILTTVILECNLPPPFKVVTLDEALKDLVSLSNSHVVIEKRQVAGLKASNHFHEQNLWKCKTSKGMSPAEAWQDPVKLKHICRGIALAQGHGITNVNLRRYTNLNMRLPSQFRPAVAKGLYDKFGNKGRILDPCSGWGDRLVGFWASNCAEYVGVDPNSSLFEAYASQIKAYSGVIPGKTAVIHNSSIEDIDDNTLGTFDFGFTSPPYWITEPYSDHEGQSSKRYPVYHLWVEGFLKPLVQLMAKTCKTFAININDAVNQTLVSDLLTCAASVGAKMIQEFKYSLPPRPESKTARSEPIFVFQI